MHKLPNISYVTQSVWINQRSPNKATWSRIRSLGPGEADTMRVLFRRTSLSCFHPPPLSYLSFLLLLVIIIMSLVESSFSSNSYSDTNEDLYPLPENVDAIINNIIKAGSAIFINTALRTHSSHFILDEDTLFDLCTHFKYPLFIDQEDYFRENPAYRRAYRIILWKMLIEAIPKVTLDYDDKGQLPPTISIRQQTCTLHLPPKAIPTLSNPNPENICYRFYLTKENGYSTEASDTNALFMVIQFHEARRAKETLILDKMPAQWNYYIRAIHMANCNHYIYRDTDIQSHLDDTLVHTAQTIVEEGLVNLIVVGHHNHLTQARRGMIRAKVGAIISNKPLNTIDQQMNWTDMANYVTIDFLTIDEIPRSELLANVTAKKRKHAYMNPPTMIIDEAHLLGSRSFMILAAHCSDWKLIFTGCTTLPPVEPGMRYIHLINETVNLSRVYDTIPLYKMPKVQSLKNINHLTALPTASDTPHSANELFHKSCMWWFLQFYRILCESKITIDTHHTSGNDGQKKGEATATSFFSAAAAATTISDIWIRPRVNITADRPVITGTKPLTVSLQLNLLHSYINTFEQTNYQKTSRELEKLHIVLDLTQCELYTRDEWLSFVSLTWHPRNVIIHVDDSSQFKSPDYKLINDKIGSIGRGFKKRISVQLIELISLLTFWAIRSTAYKPCVPYTRDFRHSL